MHVVPFVINIGTALLLGVAIGLERQYRHHPAGLRMNALVCLGAALFVSLSLMINPNSAPDRIAAQVVSGIGFLGGGVILREGLNVRGLATAATMWCSAAVGVLAGMGFLKEAAIGTVAVLAVHLALRPLAHKIDVTTKAAPEVETIYRMRVVCQATEAAVIRAIFMRHINAQPHMTVQGISTQETDQPGTSAVVVDVNSYQRNDKYLNDLVSRISIEPHVSAVSWERVQ